MLIIVDKKIPEEAKINLQKMGELMEIETSDITYPAISGHPDIFFTRVDKQLLAAPNLPSEYFDILQNHKINFHVGEKSPGKKYPESARYNAVVSSQYLVHNTKITDTAILQFCVDKIKINVKQGYTRCSMLFLDDDHVITSDEKIASVLENKHIETLLVTSQGIDLPGFKNGFFGGCCGVVHNSLYILGNLDKYPDGEIVHGFAAKINIRLIELCNAPLFDGGGVFFV